MKRLFISTSSIIIAFLSASACSSSNDQGHPAPSGSQRHHVPTVPTKVIDAALGFEIELNVDNADVCVLWPMRLQDPVACADVDTETFNKHYALVKRGPVLMAALRYDDGTASLTIIASAGVVKSQDQMDGYFAGMTDGLKTSPSMILKMTGSQPGSQYDLLKIDGIDAARYEVTIETPPNDPNPSSKHQIDYALFGNRGSMTIQFSTDPAHIGQMRQSAESIMKTVHWSSPTSKEFVDRGARAQEKRSGKTYDWVAGLALLLVMVAAMFGLKSRTKRQS